MIQRILDSILILPTMANMQPPRFVESARKAWRGLQALPDIVSLEEHRDRLATIIDESFGMQPVIPMESLLDTLERELYRRHVAHEDVSGERDKLSKHVASLEKQLAAACGGLEAERAAHEHTLRKLGDAQRDLVDADNRESELKGEYERDRLMNQCSTDEVSQALCEMFGAEKGEHETLTDALYRVLRDATREAESKVASRQAANEALAAELATERAAYAGERNRMLDALAKHQEELQAAKRDAWSEGYAATLYPGNLPKLNPYK